MAPKSNSYQFGGPVVLVGAGNMGLALLRGWLGKFSPSDFFVQEPLPRSEAKILFGQNRISVASQIEDTLPHAASVIVLAVKPQAIDAVLPALSKLVTTTTMVISIAAGKTLASIERHLPKGTAVVRAMPNTPAAIGKGISGVVANRFTSETQKTICHELLGVVGDVVWIANEGLMDAVTAVSGSGPAYVFLLAETLADAGVAAGLDAETAKRLATATVSGAGGLLYESTSDPATLRQNVTSPGGTTAAALAVLMREGHGLQELMTEAVLEAQKRSRELGG